MKVMVANVRATTTVLSWAVTISHQGGIIMKLHFKKFKFNKLQKHFSWKAFTLLALGLFVVGGAAGCGRKSQLQQIKSKKVLTMATSADYAPFEFPVVQHGHKHIIGYDIMIGHKIADKMGVKLKVNSMEFPSVLTEVKNGKADMGVAGITATKQRRKALDFSKPYYTEKDVLLVKKADANKFNTAADAKGKEIGAQQSSTQVTLAKKDLKGAKLVQESLVTSLATDLKNGKLDGVVAARPIAQEYVKKYPNRYALAKVKIHVPSSLKYIEIALPKNQPELKKEVNSEITHLKKSGQLDTMFQKAQALQDKYNK